MCLMWGGESSGEGMGRRLRKANQGKKGSESVKGQEEMLFEGKVKREKRSRDLLETFASQQTKSPYRLLCGVDEQSV